MISGDYLFHGNFLRGITYEFTRRKTQIYNAQHYLNRGNGFTLNRTCGLVRIPMFLPFLEITIRQTFDFITAFAFGPGMGLF